MKAAVFHGDRAVRVRPVETPEPGPRQVRVRMEGCGVCGSNVPVFEGREWFDYPLPPGAPGHEGWGRIDAIGDEVTGFDFEDRVAVLSTNAFAEHDVADASAVVPLPPRLDGRPFPAEPLACAMNVLRRSEIEAGQTVAVIGIGFLGALLTGLCRAAGARVVAVSRRPWALEVAEEQGAERTIALDDDPAGRIDRLTRGAGCARVIECAGKQSTLDLAGAVAGERARVMIAGFHQDGPRTVDMQSWNWKGLDVINAHERQAEVYVRGVREAIVAVAEGRLDPYPLLTHSFPLAETGRALELASERPDGFLKAWIDLTPHGS
jgi:threonine dehydrogenase-like Zn-dependent dehydrogenase